MKFVTFAPAGYAARFGFLLNNGQVVDLEAAGAALLARELPLPKARELAAALTPGDALSFLEGGAYCLDFARRVHVELEEKVARGERPVDVTGETILFDPSSVQLCAPLRRPRKFIAAGKNFRDHMAEMASAASLPEQPVAFPQFADAIVGPDAVIPYPSGTQSLDYEVEVAVVIGKRAYCISAEQAWDHVFGFTIFNDISARDVYRRERASGIPLMGKNLPAFAPLGPFLCTRDEVPDPHAIRLGCRVNGEIRQAGTTADMVFPFEELIAYWSKIGLQPGDIITSGTPSGVAASRKSGEEPWWLQSGDVVEAEVDRLGVLRNTII